MSAPLQIHLTEQETREVIDLLRDSQSDFRDPALRRAYGRRRKAMLDRLLGLLPDLEEPAGAPPDFIDQLETH